MEWLVRQPHLHELTQYYPIIVPELACADFIESLRFYIAILGFRIRYDRPEEQFAYLDLDGAELMLTHAGIRLVHGIPSYPFGHCLNLQIEVQDVDTLYANVVAAGVPLFLPMEERWYRQGRHYTGNRQFVVSDPDGYLLRLFQDLGLRMENEDHGACYFQYVPKYYSKVQIFVKHTLDSKKPEQFEESISDGTAVQMEAPNGKVSKLVSANIKTLLPIGVLTNELLNPEMFIQNAISSGLTIVKGKEKFLDRDSTVIVINRNEGKLGNKLTIWFDNQAGIILKIVFSTDGNPVQTIAFDQIKFPNKVSEEKLKDLK